MGRDGATIKCRIGLGISEARRSDTLRDRKKDLLEEATLSRRQEFFLVNRRTW